MASATIPCVPSQITAVKYRIGPKMMAIVLRQPRGQDQVFVSISSCCQPPR
jgi:hypothetical protein